MFFEKSLSDNLQLLLVFYPQELQNEQDGHDIGQMNRFSEAL